MWLEHLTTEFLNHVAGHRRSKPEAGLRLGRSIAERSDTVIWPDRYRCEHAVVLGKTGSGKTYFLESLAVQLAQRREGFALIDFHGDVSLSLLGRLKETPGVEERLVILDPSHPTRSAGVNVLEAGDSDTERFRRVAELSAILRQRWGVDAFGARTEELLRNSLYTLAHGRRTVVDLPRFLTDLAFRRTLTEHLAAGEVRNYWEQRYEPLSEAMKGAFREPLLNRVTGFLTEPAARHLLGQAESTIDFDQVLARGQWLIVRLPKGRLREHAHTLGNLILAKLQFAVLAREALPRHRRATFTLLCDEAQNFAENDLSTLFTEGRKFGVSLVTANQFWDQLPRELRGALLSANAHICFRVSTSDAALLAGELSPNRRSRLSIDLTQLSRGEAVARLSPTHLERFRVPALPRTDWIHDHDFDRLLLPYTRERHVIEAALRPVPPGRPTPAPTAGPLVGEEGLDGW